METKIDIIAILKNKPKKTKLWSSMFGNGYLYTLKLNDMLPITVETEATGGIFSFTSDGRFNASCKDGECLLFPSKLMRDWSKFAWKKGDVLQKNSRTQVIFDSFVSDTYEVIRCKYFLTVSNGKETFVKETNEFTRDYFKVSEEQRQCYIDKIEEHFGGKLNLETLKIEKQTEFKDGDIVCMIDRFDNYCFIFIYRNEDDENFYYHAHITRNGFVNLGENEYLSKPRKYSVHFATDLEKQQLFDALAKKGKAWDAEKKMIVDLKKKVELKPFDKVVVRDTEYSTWCADFFSHIDVDYRYECVGATWSFCIPYNEETAKLIGTTNNWEG